MYQRFFGLRENPFSASPDPHYLFRTEHVEESLTALTYGIQNRKGFILLSGEAGTGKTTLLNHLLDWLNHQRVPTGFVLNPILNAKQLFNLILADFQIPCESQEKIQLLVRLNSWLLELYRSGGTAVVIIDEAQNLSFEVLEEIRMLTNLETSTAKLLQIVLSGQPDLEEKLKLPQLRQLRQRVTLCCRTAPLTLPELSAYLEERLRIAGANAEPIFSREAVQLVHTYSRGIPRLVNLLCEHSMISAFVDHLRPVPAHLVEEVAQEFRVGAVDSGSPALLPSQVEEIANAQALVQNLERLRQSQARTQHVLHERKP